MYDVASTDWAGARLYPSSGLREQRDLACIREILNIGFRAETKVAKLCDMSPAQGPL